MLTEIAAPWAAVVPDAPFPMSAADLARLPEDGRLYELVGGRLVRMPTRKPRHGDIALDLGAALRIYVKANGLGRAFGNDSGFTISRSDQLDTVLGADVAVVRAERVPPKDSPLWDEYFPFAPDLVVEVASPSQFRPEMAAKVLQWLAGGTPLVWLVWPIRQEVEIRRAGGDMPVATLTIADSLDGEDVVPGFVYPLAELFA